jgi:hypothetical protein
MEDVLDVYARPYDARWPVVGMDELPVQLVGHTRPPLPSVPGVPARIDYEYERKGTANVFLAVEPLVGRRVTQVTAHRTKQDWAHFIQALVDTHYPDAERIVLVLDNLNTHGLASLYEAFPAAEARRLARRLDLHHTPVHGSWLNVAEIELSILTGQCLDRRIPARSLLEQEGSAWTDRRNGAAATIDWQFRTNDARIKLKHLYPSFTP